MVERPSGKSSSSARPSSVRSVPVHGSRALEDGRGAALAGSGSGAGGSLSVPRRSRQHPGMGLFGEQGSDQSQG